MNKLNFSFVLAFAFLFAIAMTSAVSTAPSNNSIVTGTVYNGNNLADPVSGAFVNVSCAGDLRSTTTDAGGSYQVTFFNSPCGYGSTATVFATKDGKYGNETKVISSSITFLQVVIGVQDIDVPLIPEFGLIAGTAAIAGAFGLFFFVRRK